MSEEKPPVIIADGDYSNIEARVIADLVSRLGAETVKEAIVANKPAELLCEAKVINLRKFSSVLLDIDLRKEKQSKNLPWLKRNRKRRKK